MIRGLTITCAAAVVLAVPARAGAQRLELSVSPGVIAFPSADPDTTPVLSSAPVTIQFRVRNNQRDTWHMTVLAAGDLISADSTVDISSVSWIATPAPPFRNGALSKTVPQIVASGTGNEVPMTTGSLTFRLTNSWTYDAGLYTQTLIFTLSVP